MPVRRHGRRHVHQVHHLPAQQFSQRVRLRRQNDFCHLRPRRAHRLPLQLRFTGILVSVLPFHPHPRLALNFDAFSRPRIIRDHPMTEQKKTRRQMLEEFVATKPDDAFSRYGLALECMNNGDSASAGLHFRALLERNADYIPAYLMYGQLLVREQRIEEAKQVLANGIVAAVKKGNEHARSEMEALLTELS